MKLSASHTEAKRCLWLWVCGTATAALLMIASSAAAETSSPKLPPSGAASCSGCHAPAAAGGLVPAIAGRPVEEIVTAMAEFRADQRPSTVMNRIAKGFTDEEIRAIADWLAAGQDQAAKP
jgi:cytochrome subunit of sulfide dehydrogenase